MQKDHIFTISAGRGCDASSLCRELLCATRLGRATHFDASIYSFDGGQLTTLMAEVGRLRMEAFRGVGVDMCEHVDGILADLGVSSHHFDAKHRGFSFRGEAPLDMRMNTRGGRTAADIVNTYTNDALTRIFAEYGELDTTWKIANCIERARSQKPITTTAELVEAVKPCTPPKDEAKFLTKLFQALRIELNGEMEALKMALEQSLKILKPEGRLVVMSYHSLEDRIVKNFMRSGNTEGRIEKDFFGRQNTPFKLITRKAITPTAEELERNTRSRSAKLRVAEKIDIE